MAELGPARCVNPGLKPRQSWLPLLLFGVAALVGVPRPAAATPHCPALGPFGFGVTLTNPGAPLDGYLALLTIDTATAVAAGEMRADSGDLRVSGTACNPYRFWVESGLNTRATRVWVRVPAVPTGDSRFFVHHGSPTPTYASSLEGVFGSGLSLLATFTEGAGTVLHNRVFDLYDFELQGTAAWTAGPRGNVGGINNLASTGRLVDGLNGPALLDRDFTVFVMVNLLATDRNGSPRGLIGNYRDDQTYGWLLKMQGAPGQFMFLTNHSGNWCQAPGGNVAAGTWTMIGARRRAGVTGVTNSLFQNGNRVADICANDTRWVNGGDGPFEIGRGYNGDPGTAIGGAVSMAMVYSRALEDGEASALYSSLFPAVPPAITIVPKPGPPAITGVAVTPTSITLSFTPGTGSAITGYTARCTAGALVFGSSGPLSPLTVSGLTPGVQHACTVSASNEFGMGSPSIPLVATTPVPPVVTSAAATTFTEIAPGTFTVTATGQPTPTLALAGALPAGVIFDSATGVLAGTPAPGTAGAYRLTITASNGVVPSATQPFTLTVLSAVPHPPINLRAAASGSLVSLTWDAAPTGTPAEWFQFELGNVSGLTNLLINVTRGPGEVGLLPDGRYLLRVRGVNRAGLGAPSTEVTVQVSAGQVIAGPVGALDVSVNGDAVTVSWSPPTIGAAPTGYRLEVGRSHGAADVAVLDLPASSTTFSARGVPPGVYSARIRPMSPAGLSARSHDVMFVVGQPVGCAVAPSRPVLLTPVVFGSTAALAWLPQDDFVATTGYSLQVGSTSGGSNLGVFSRPIPTSSLVATAPNGVYFVRLVANNACGESAHSAEQAVTVGTVIPAVPSGLTAQVAGRAVTLNWTAPPGGVTGYVLEAGNSSGATFVSLPTGSATPTFSVSNVPSGTYYVRVRAQNAAGTGAASNEVMVVVP